MTRKDSILIANGIQWQVAACIKDREALVRDRDSLPVADYQMAIANVQVRINMLESLAETYANGLAAGSAAFNRARFLNACGL